MLSHLRDTLFIAHHYLDELLTTMMHHKISDAHLEPMQDSFRIRLRLDGILHEALFLRKEEGQSLMSRIKILAHLDIAQQRIPQDGRLQYEKFAHIDCRVSTCPTIFGEKLVLRYLKTMADALGLDELGLAPTQKDIFLTSIQQPQGLILVTGPTGSGKTVTLYSALQLLNKPTMNIITIEDPVEIKLAGVNQINIAPKIDLTFARCLCAILRQDPDIIMIGEMRDQETADIAITAAQTGHLVLSTLHTNNAVDTLNRLQQMGIPPDQLARSLLLVIAQRLLRKRCLYCTHSCNACHNGYQGRTAVYELIPISDTIRTMMGTNQLDQLRHYLSTNGWLSMRAHAEQKIVRGITTTEELKRVLGG